MNGSPEELRQQADELERQAKAARRRADRDTQIWNTLAPARVLVIAGALIAAYLCILGR